MILLHTRAQAFVHQKELLYGYLTPREHLIFHAYARMSRTYTREALLARVEEVRGGGFFPIRLLYIARKGHLAVCSSSC